MKITLLLICIFSFIHQGIAQKFAGKVRLYETTISTIHGKIKKVNLFALTDTSIIVTSKYIDIKDIYSYDYQTNQEILIEEIKLIKFRPKDSAKEGFVMGALIGIFAPLSYYLEESGQEENISIQESICVGLSFAVISTLVGGAIGSKYACYSINYDMKCYNVLRKEMRRFTLLGNYYFENRKF